MEINTADVGILISVPPPVSNTVLLANDNADTCLYLENRFAGPLSIGLTRHTQGASNVGLTTGPRIHVPPLSRVSLPWDSGSDAVIFYAYGEFVQNYINGANDPGPNAEAFQISSVRYAFHSQGIFPPQELYPLDLCHVVTHAITGLNGNNPGVAHGVVSGPSPILLPTGRTANYIQIYTQNLTSQQPSVTKDARIMAFRVTEFAGTSIASNLEAALVNYIDTTPGGQGNIPAGTTAVNPFGSNALATAHVGSETVQCPGAVAIAWYIADGATGTTANINVAYWLGIPYD